MKKLRLLLLAALLLTGLLFTQAMAETENGFNYSVEDECAVITGYSGTMGTTLTIPDTLGGYPVVKIGNSAFSGYTQLTSVTFPEGLVTIGANAFKDCTGITGELVLPSTLTSLGKGALSTTRIGSITLPVASIENYRDGSTVSNYTLYYAHLPTSVWKITFTGEGTIPYRAFADVTQLTSVICEGVTGIDVSAFDGCTSLTKLQLCDTIQTIGNSAFCGCTALASELHLPEGLTSMGSFVFQNCAKMTGSVVIPQGLTQISSGTFTGCSSLDGGIVLHDGIESIGSYAFNECTNLSGELQLPSSLQTIGQYAFYNCRTLSGSLVIPEGVTEIPASAFELCSGMKGTLTLPSTLETIRGCAFKRSGFTGQLTLPDSVTLVEGAAFMNCYYFTSLKLSGGMTTINSSTFNSCTRLTGDLIIPENITYVDQGAFYNCQSFNTLLILHEGMTIFNAPDAGSKAAFQDCNFSKVIAPISAFPGYANSRYALNYYKQLFYNGTFPVEFELIGNAELPTYAFSGATYVTRVVLDESITAIPASCFGSCTRLTSIAAPGVTDIGNSAFNGCTALSGEVSFPAAVSIGTSAFKNTAITSLSLPAFTGTLGADAFSGVTTITALKVTPDFLTNNPLSSTLSDCTIDTLHLVGTGEVPANLCKGMTSLTTLTLGEGITAIGNSAFEGCTGLASLSLPQSLERIGNRALMDCTGLLKPEYGLSGHGLPQPIVLPDQLKEIGDYAFALSTEDNLMYAQLNLPDSIERIGAYAFKNLRCTRINNLPASLTSMGTGAFNNAWLADSIVVPEGLTAIPDHAFSFSRGMEDGITLPNTLESIGQYAFSYCWGLSSITIPASVRSIDDYAFYYAEKLSSLTLSPGLVTIGVSAFENCDLYRLTLPDTVESIGPCSFYRNQLQSLKLSASLKTIAQSAFYGAKITSVEIPQGVEVIESYAFSKTSLVSVYLPDSVVTVKDNAFSECAQLTEVRLSPAMTEIAYKTFYQCNALAVPELHEGLTSIGSYSFSGTAACDVHLPASLETVGDHAFASRPIGVLSFADLNFTVDATSFSECTLEEIAVTEQQMLDKLSVLSSITDSVRAKVLRVSGSGMTPRFSFTGMSFDKLVLDGYTYTGVGSFKLCTELTDVDLGSIVALSDSSFICCTMLTNITFNPAMSFIGDKAFDGCSSLVIPDLTQTAVTHIGAYAFRGCLAPEQLVLTEAFTYIGESAFANVPVAQLTMPVSMAVSPNPEDPDNATSCLTQLFGSSTAASVKRVTLTGAGEIGPWAFAYTKLSSIDMRSADVTAIGMSAFAKATDLMEVKFSSSLVTLGDNVFSGCTSLTVLLLPDSVTTLGGSCFAGCTSLTYVGLPNSLQEMGTNVFSSCSSLEDIEFPAGCSLTEVPFGTFLSCTSLRRFYLCDSMRSIGGMAFAECTSLDGYLMLPPQIESIGSMAFMECTGIDAVVLGEGITSIGADAFNLIKGLFNKNGLKAYCVPDSYAASVASSQYLTYMPLTESQFQTLFHVNCPSSLELRLGIRQLISDRILLNRSIIGYRGIEVVSTNSEVCTYEDGMVSAVGLGSAPLEATFVWPPFRTAPSQCVIDVVVDMTDFTLPARIVMPVNSSLQVEPESISPEGALTGFSYSVSNSLFASVDADGLITSNAFTGATTLVVSSYNGIIRRSELVIAPAISSVTFAEDAGLILVGSQLQLYATAVMGDESCVNRFLTFSTSDPAVADVDQAGLVTGTGKGTATITAQSNNGVTATYTLTIRDDENVLTLPAALQQVEAEAFARNTAVDIVILPDGMTAIGERAFVGCQYLYQVEIPATVTSIADDAFEGCGPVIIRCDAGSYAEQYAQAHGLTVSLR